MNDLAGRAFLVTGGTNGIGLEAAVLFAARGADVTIVGRDPARTEAAVATIGERAGRPVESVLCDFASLDSIRGLAAEFRSRHGRLHVLLNNAGTVFAERTITADGFEATFAVNHLGYFLLTDLLRDLLVQSAPARIVNVSSEANYRGTLDFDDMAMEKGYWVMGAYARSKLCNVLFTRRLARELEGTGVTVNCLHPGRISTNIWSHAPGWAKPGIAVVKWFMQSPQDGGKNLEYACTSPELDGKTGLYLHQRRIQDPAKLAMDDAVADRLWEESARMVGAR